MNGFFENLAGKILQSLIRVLFHFFSYDAMVKLTTVEENHAICVVLLLNIQLNNLPMIFFSLVGLTRIGNRNMVF